jgi:hypothetical protein
MILVREKVPSDYVSKMLSDTLGRVTELILHVIFVLQKLQLIIIFMLATNTLCI